MKTKAVATGWNMIGRPAHFSSRLGDVNVQASTEACEGGCDLNAAESKTLVHNHLWTYDETSYTQVINPDGTLEAWVGYWVATLNSADLSNPKLLIPKADSSPLPENPLSGRVTATTGVELTGVAVKVLKNGVEQSTTTTTNAEGEFGLSLDPETEYTLSFTAPGYANQVQRVKTSLVGQEVNLDVVLTPRGETQTVADSTSVTLTGTDGATVSLNPQFVDSQGNVVTASDGIKLTITPVDVSTPAGIAAFPGDFAGVPEGQSDASPIVSYGTVEYQFTRASDGEELQLKTGEQADIQIPIYTKKHQDGTAIKAGDSIPLWSLNEATGLWTQEGAGTVVASTSSPTGFALQAAVSHFSWWNADVTMNSANAIITVAAPEVGTAVIKARTAADLAWGPNTVDTVISVGGSTQPLPIPSNGEVCFWAEVNFTSGNNATTPESCVTAAPNATVNVSLDIQGGALSLVANPDEKVTVYINAATVQTKVQPTTLESSVSYVLESGTLPAGVILTAINDTAAVISGVPTEAGSFNPVIKGTDADGNTATVALSFTVIDGVALKVHYSLGSQHPSGYIGSSNNLITLRAFSAEDEGVKVLKDCIIGSFTDQPDKYHMYYSSENKPTNGYDRYAYYAGTEYDGFSERWMYASHDKNTLLGAIGSGGCWKWASNYSGGNLNRNNNFWTYFCPNQGLVDYVRNAFERGESLSDPTGISCD